MSVVCVPTKFLSPPNAHLICSVCRGLFREPVINIKCGHTFCRQCIIGEALNNNFAKCPQDAVTCDLEALVVNRSLESQIEDLLIYCRHGLCWTESENDYMLNHSGCHQKIKYGKRQEHEDTCGFGPVSCPNSATTCGSVCRKDLEQHLQNCKHVGCQHKTKGCTFTGSKVEVTEHAQTCGFRGLSNIQDTSDALRENTELSTEVTSLRQRVSVLEAEKDALHGHVKNCLRLIAVLTEQHKSLSERVEKIPLLRRSPSSPKSASAKEGSPSLVRSPSSRKSHKAPDDTWQMPFHLKSIGTLRGHSDAVCDLKTYKSLLFSAGADNIIKVWDLEGLAKGCTQTLKGHTNKIRCLCVGRTYLYSAGADCTLRAWSLADLSNVNVIQEAHDDIVAALVCKDDFVFSSSHTVIKVWDATSLELQHSMTGLKHWVRTLAFNVAKDRLYSGSHNTIEVWDALGKFNLAGKISHTYGSVYALTVTEQYIIAGTYNNNIHVFDVTSQTYVCKLMGHVSAVTSLTATGSGRFLFSCSTDSKIQVWSLENFLPIQVLSRHEDGVNVVVLHNDLLLSGSDDKEIKVYKYFKMDMGFIPS